MYHCSNFHSVKCQLSLWVLFLCNKSNLSTFLKSYLKDKWNLVSYVAMWVAFVLLALKLTSHHIRWISPCTFCAVSCTVPSDEFQFCTTTSCSIDFVLDVYFLKSTTMFTTYYLLMADWDLYIGWVHKVTSATSVDISAICAKFCMKFYAWGAPKLSRFEPTRLPRLRHYAGQVS